MFKSISNKAFEQYFRDEGDYLRYLTELSWKDGYECKKCRCKQWWHARKGYDQRCQQCSYNEPPTSGSPFYKLNFGLLKAFRVIYPQCKKEGGSSCDLARAFGIR